MKTIEICRAEPAQGSSDYNSFTASSLPLTFFDIRWLRLPPLERLFYYEFPHPTTHFFDHVLPNLKQSLALALGYFLPLSGHITWPHDSPKPFIKFVPGDAISLVIAESDLADFDHLSSFDLCEATECRHLVPHLTILDDQASVMALQVTLFPNHGFCIGISSHHAVVDGQTSDLFRKSWAYLCKNLKDQSGKSSMASLTADLAPFFDRSIIKDPNGIEDIFIREWLNHCGPNNRSLKVWETELPQEAIRGIFELTCTDIEKLKQFVAAKLLQGNNKDKNCHLSTFLVSCAYSWTCRVKAEGMTKKKVQLFINVDCRSRLEPPLPKTYFGNCIANRRAIAETRELLGENGFLVAVKAMVEAIETLKDGVLSGLEKGNTLFQGFHNSDIKSFGAASSPRFEVYSTNFGWGRPKKADIVSAGTTAAICFSDSRNGNGGIEIGLTLQKSVMEKFSSYFVEGLEAL